MQNGTPRLLLPSPEGREDASDEAATVAPTIQRRRVRMAPDAEVASSDTVIDVVRDQRDGLARRHSQLSETIRRLRAENDVLRKQLTEYAGYPSSEEQRREVTDAQALETEHGIRFRTMPESVYPGMPYVTQQDLLKGGTTRYSRQNISRLVRVVKALPSVVIGDRVLLPPAAVRALLSRESAAAQDTSPRRRPGRKPTDASSRSPSAPKS